MTEVPEGIPDYKALLKEHWNNLEVVLDNWKYQSDERSLVRSILLRIIEQARYQLGHHAHDEYGSRHRWSLSCPWDCGVVVSMYDLWFGTETDIWEVRALLPDDEDEESLTSTP